VPLDWNEHFERDTASRAELVGSFRVGEGENSALQVNPQRGTEFTVLAGAHLHLMSHLASCISSAIGLLDMVIVKRIAAMWPYLLISVALIGLAYDAWKSLIAR
jgi:hypothetical protein